jgi:ribosomal protein L34
MKPSTLLRNLALLALAACATAPRAAPAPTTGDEVIRAMHGRYAGRWYRTIAFTQKTTISPPGRPERVETWEEYGSIPGRLRIETGPGRGVIFSGDSTFSIAGDSVARRTKGRNELMTLGFDVYAQAPAVSASQLREHGFALDRFRTDTWQGRPVYVVGAGPGDGRTKQFWVDAERLVFVRMLEPVPNDSVRVQDLRFNNYERAGGGWVAPEVEIVVDGKRVFHEAYSNVRVDIPLDSSLWVPERWREARHP